MRMPDPVPQFTHLATALRAAHPNLAYLHLIEPRVAAEADVEHPSTDSNDFLREVWKGKPVISAGGYDREGAMKTSDETGDLIAFGRHYIANVGFPPLISNGIAKLMCIVQPDLVERLKNNIPLNKYDRSTFYIPMSPVGYLDQPFASRN
jgi:NADPH2 dehydrogenase